MLRIEGASVRFPGREQVAVDSVDLVVGDGETVCVLGPSGSGKSTLLRAVAGLEPLVTGRIVLDGRDLAGIPPHRRGVGLMFQDYALFPHRDVAANVAFGLRMRGDLRPAEVRARVGSSLEQVGLAGFERRPVSRLSGGEQQRVALARALAPEPRLLMLDEPLGALDLGLRERLLLELAALFERLAVTALYVTHDQGEAFALADRVVLLRAGRAVQGGPPDEVWRRPVDEDAARFLGLVNIVDATVRGARAHTAWGPMPVAPTSGDGPVRLVIRPEALVPAVPPAGQVSGTVAGRSFRGDHFILVVATDAGPVLEVSLRGDAVPAPGDRIHLDVDPSGLLVLPPTSPHHPKLR